MNTFKMTNLVALAAFSTLLGGLGLCSGCNRQKPPPPVSEQEVDDLNLDLDMGVQAEPSEVAPGTEKASGSEATSEKSPSAEGDTPAPGSHVGEDPAPAQNGETTVPETKP